ncbi:MAG TPA: response regulator [Gemmatimonadales bacterium]|nr:response regulator [Gemmatimonadales bacterium]
MTQRKSPIPSILVVDDEPIVRGAVVRILGGWGFRVHEAETAEEAMTVLSSFAGEQPQLVIIDIILPGDNGILLAQQIREEFPQQRILFMSAYPTEVLWTEGLRDGTEEFMPKPFTAAQLIRKVEAALSRGGPAASSSLG